MRNIVGVVLFFLPFILARDTGAGTRYAWVLALLFSLVVTVAIREGKKAGRVLEDSNRHPRMPGPYERRYGPMMLNAITLIYVATVFLAIAATYSVSGEFSGDTFFAQLDYIGSTIFPVVAKMDSELGLPRERLLLLRIETTLFDGAVITACAVFVLFWLMMPGEEKRNAGKARLSEMRARGEARYAIGRIISVPVGVVLFSGEYWGWLKLDNFDPTSSVRGRGCIISARCFGRLGDVIIIGGSALSSIALLIGASAFFLMYLTIMYEEHTCE